MKFVRLASVDIQSSLLCWCSIDWFPCLEERSARCARSFDCVDLYFSWHDERKMRFNTDRWRQRSRFALSLLSPIRLTVGSFCTTSQRWFKRIFSFTDQKTSSEKKLIRLRCAQCRLRSVDQLCLRSSGRERERAIKLIVVSYVNSERERRETAKGIDMASNNVWNWLNRMDKREREGGRERRQKIKRRIGTSQQ